MNLCKLYYYEKNYEKCRNLSESALMRIESNVFDIMRNNSNDLLKNPSDIILLLNGYLLFAKSSQHIAGFN